MSTKNQHLPIHEALDHVARSCIDENFVEEAEAMLVFLEQINISPLMHGVLRVWVRSHQGDLREALRHCVGLLHTYPDSQDVMALLAVLQYSTGDPTWRTVCERLLGFESGRPEHRQLAESLLNGSFGRKKVLAPPEPAHAAPPEKTASHGFDFNIGMDFIRA